MSRRPTRTPGRRIRGRSPLSLVAFGLLVLLAGCADDPLTPALGGAVGRSASLHPPATVSVPFNGSFSGHDVSITPQADGIHFLSEMAGEITGLGRTTQVIDYVLEYDLIHFAGQETITAADGSRLFLAFEGTVPDYPEQVFPTAYSLDWTIIGGTGRLADNAGTGRVDGLVYGQGRFDGKYQGVRLVPVGH